MYGDRFSVNSFIRLILRENARSFTLSPRFFLRPGADTSFYLFKTHLLEDGVALHRWCSDGYLALHAHHHGGGQGTIGLGE